MLNKIKKHWDNKRKKTIEVIAEENIREMEYLMENFKRIEQKNKITLYPSIEPKRKIDEEEFNKTIKPISTIKFNEKYKVMTHIELYKSLFSQWIQYVHTCTNRFAEFNHYFLYYIMYNCKLDILINIEKCDSNIIFNIEQEDVVEQLGELIDCVIVKELEIEEDKNRIIRQIIDDLKKQNLNTITLKQIKEYAKEILSHFKTVNENGKNSEHVIIKTYSLIPNCDFQSFIGLTIMMGALNDNTKPLKGLFNGKYFNDFYMSVMSYDRYIFIRRNLIFHDIRTNSSYTSDIKVVYEFLKKLNHLEQIKTDIFDLIKEEEKTVTNRDGKQTSNVTVTKTQPIDVDKSFPNSQTKETDCDKHVSSSQKMEEEQDKSSKILDGLLVNEISGIENSPKTDPINNSEVLESDKIEFEEVQFEEYLNKLQIVLCDELKYQCNKLKLDINKLLQGFGDNIKDDLYKRVEMITSIDLESRLKALNKSVLENVNTLGVKKVSGIGDISNDYVSEITKVIEDKSHSINLKMIKFNSLYKRMNLFKDKINLITKNYKNGIDMFFSKIANCSNDIKIIKNKCKCKLEGELDLYSTAQDTYFLVKEMMGVFNECLKNTTIDEYGSNISVDETMIYAGCRTTFKIHIPSKPANQGLLFYNACDAVDRFMFYIKFYRGKVESPSCSVGEKLLLSIINEIKYIKESVHITVFVDSFFTNICSAYELDAVRDVSVIGTVSKRNHDTPDSVYDFSKMKDGQYVIYDVNGSNIKYIKIKDRNRELLMLSTVQRNNEIVEVVKENYLREKNYTKDISITQKEYTAYMHGVDIFDYCTSLTTCRRRTSRWSSITFEHLLEVSTLNTYTKI